MKQSAPRSRPSFRPRLQLLEDRVQPSVVPLSQLGLVASGPLHATPVAITSIPASFAPVQLDGHQADGPQAPVINYGGYLTGVSTSATATGTFVDAANNQYAVGTLINSTGNTAGYIVKLMPDSTAVDPTFNGGMPFAFRLNFGSLGVYDLFPTGVTVDTTSRHLIEMTGRATNTMTNNNLAVVISISQTGTFVNGAGFGTGAGTDPYSLDGAAADGMGDTVFTGTYTGNNGTGTPSQPNFTFAFIPAGSDAGGAQGLYYYFTDNMTMAPIPSSGTAIAIDPTPNFAEVGGTFTPAGSFKQGLTGEIPIDGMFNLTAFAFSDTTGDVVIKGAAVNNGPNDATHGGAYFVGTTPDANGGGQTDGAVLRFYGHGMGLTFDDMNSFGVISNVDPGNSVDLKGIAVNQSTGTVWFVGDDAVPGGGNSQVLVGSADMLLGSEMDTTLTGTDGSDHGNGVAVRASGGVTVVGTTSSMNGIATDGTTLMGTTDGFVLGIM
jgi:hypothetical protein